MTDLRVRAGGSEPPAFVLLHGLGGTGEVWDGLTALLGDAAWVAPDQPGHGGSAALAEYSFGAVAEAVAGLVDPADPALAATVVRAGGGWRAAFDPRASGVGEPGVASLLAAAPVPVVLARGEHDAMVSAAQLAALVPRPVDCRASGTTRTSRIPPRCCRCLPIVASCENLASLTDGTLNAPPRKTRGVH